MAVRIKIFLRSFMKLLSSLQARPKSFRLKTFLVPAALVFISCVSVNSLAQSGEVYGGLGGNLGYGVTLGYAKGYSPNTTLRAEFAGGLSLSRDGAKEGVNFNGKFTNNRVGLFGDWFPFNGGFRLTGGVTFNDTKLTLNSTSTSNASGTINGKTVNMNGRYYNVAVKFPAVTPFVGIGYGHHTKDQKGLGFFTDLGFAIGKFKAESSTDLVSAGLVTQADVNAQDQKLNDSLSKLSVLPSFSIGLRYNF
jgi:hypothetical protein